jgi:uncharacterized protein (DUF1697 family)
VSVKRYVVLLRGINVGGRNRVPMAGLRRCLQEIGCTEVATLIASGNAVVRSSLSAAGLATAIEQALPERFSLDSVLVRVLVLPVSRFRAIAEGRPDGFGEHPETYHSDVIFLLDISAREAMRVFDPRDGVDRVWPGNGAIYSQRLSAERAKSRLGKIVGTPAYGSMTIRSWNTTMRLLAMLDGPG